MCALALAGTLASACGKKGPPLAPIAHIPAAIDKLTIDRSGDDMYVSLTVPSTNIDMSMPADVGRIDVYGVTANTPPSAIQMLQAGTRVASVPVAPPPVKGEPAPATPPSEPTQGTVISIHDTLGAADLTAKPLPTTPLRGATPRTPSRATTPAPAPAAPVAPDEVPVPQRYYMALGFSEKGRQGPPGMVIGVPLTPAPAPPSVLNRSYTQDTLTLTWHPPDSAPTAADTPPALVVHYNVYRRESPDPLDLAASAPQPWRMRKPMPANPAPLDVTQFTDATDFEREVCYTVRSVRGVAGNMVEGDASEPLCVTAVDTFPPAAPKSLSAVPAEGAVSLIWEPNSEPDLAGYLVLRGEAGSATLQPLTAMPIAEAQFTDRTARSGVRYVYAVVAVDNRVPVPNVSAESNRVEETAR